jgi:hypothetical protein
MRFGRVTPGREEAHFDWMQRGGEGRKITFCMGEDGLALFETHPPHEALRMLGFSDEWMLCRLQEGSMFRLYTWEEALGDTVTEATWASIPALAQRVYPGAIAHKVGACISDIQTLGFSAIEARAQEKYLGGDARYFDVHELGSSDPRFMDAERLADPAHNGVEKVRGFLYHRFGINGLFAGDGYSRDGQGRPTIREYFTINRLWSEVPNASYVTLELNPDELNPGMGST